MWGVSHIRRATNSAFGLLGRAPLHSPPRYLQQQSARKKVMGCAELAAVPTAPLRSPRNVTHVALMELDKKEDEGNNEQEGLRYLPEANALSLTDAGDDDIVLDDIHSAEVAAVSAASERDKMCENHPASRGVGVDVIDIVTDAFREERERLVQQRQRVLYDLTHPNPTDYTYGSKLVPPPPLSFGNVTTEARELGNKVMLEQNYSLVKQAGVRRDPNATNATRISRRSGKAAVFDNHNYFFEVNEVYQEIVLVGKACAGKSSLLNALLGQKVAKTSSSPHTTREISFYQSVSPDELQRFLSVKGNGLVKLPGGGLQLTFVDVPGFGIAGMSDQWRDRAIELTDAYLGVRRSVNTVLFCIDCERGLTKTDLKYFEWLENLHGVFFVVLTKCDSVPHSRICSVMRQIYSTITKQRRKYRKVFPFVIPTSAQDGTNMELLRGLLAETSGLIPGDRLRQLLKAKAEADMQAVLEAEAARLQDAQRESRAAAKALFIGSPSGPDPAITPQPGKATKNTTRHFRIHLEKDGERGNIHSEGECKGEAATDEANWQRRQRFLAWRQAHPLQRHTTDYGATFRLNTGLDHPSADWVDLPYTETDKTQPDTTNDPVAEETLREAEGKIPEAAHGSSTTSLLAHSSIIGLNRDGGDDKNPFASAGDSGGNVSRFLDALEQYARRDAAPPRRRLSKRQRQNELRWRERLDNGPATRFLVEEGDGRLAEYKGGRKFGPSLVEPNGIARRREQWEAQQYAREAVATCPETPWAALDALKRRAEVVRQKAAMRGMSRKDMEAYMRNSGRVTEGFERFHNEVAAEKYMNEVRQAPTLRSQQQMHLNSTAKISYRAMPVGLWKKYGERDTHWPTPRVIGKDKETPRDAK